MIINSGQKLIANLPKFRIYKSGEETFRMYSNDGDKYVGIMLARPEFVTEKGIYPNMKNFWAYYVVGLDAKVKYQGVGKAFNDLLKKLSKEDERCEGRVYLRAFNNIEPSGRPSSTWWYARGYRGCDKRAQEDLDRVRMGIKPKSGDWYRDMDMYLPIK